MPTSPSSIPLPPPEAASYDKQPGHTVNDLAAKTTSPPPINTSTPAPPASAPASPLPPPATVKRAVSASAPSTPAVPGRAPSRAASIASEASQSSHKFTLKDLLASGPKLSRKSSARSASSRHSADSESERSHGKAKSTKSGAGGSVGSLSQKYGVCQKIAIGKGATSVVRLAHKWDRSDGDKMYAVKRSQEFRKRRRNETEKEYVKKLTAEFCISSTLHHVNIVETVDLVQDEQGRWCEVMEVRHRSSIVFAHRLKNSPSSVLVVISTPQSRKAACLPVKSNVVSSRFSKASVTSTPQGVAHRDLKPENLFFDTVGHLKIGDYGASTVYRLPWEGTIHMSTGLCGSEPYIAPEQFLGKPYDARLVDIWACGIVYYCLHFQELPWRAAQSSDQLYAAYATAAAATPAPPVLPASTTNGHTQTASESRDRNHTNPALVFPPTINNLSPRACRPLIRKMLEPDPKARATIEDVLGSAWISGVEVCWEAGDNATHVHVNARAMARAVEAQADR
ncbi:Pkinase-domain-containing protein [Mycena kentingensis (nom. inval.)]|nr:Pkinase-domain-containing protein [Mycena kentingensis (nom. inval.)]